MPRFCIIIPVYNHGRELLQVLPQLVDYNLHCLIINDGSGSETNDYLDQANKKFEWITIITLEKNGGKGAAVKAGLRFAYDQQYTHALQIDADGQHCLEDIQKFMDESIKYPDALVLGQPIFGKDVPQSRLIGRQISRFWVWVETISKSIQDPLFGFRIYPLFRTIQVLDSNRTGNKMDFDPEIAVRLYWGNVIIRNIRTKVSYPDGSISHFNMVEDNLLISWMHTKLVFEMLFRLPILLWNRIKKL